MCRPWNNHRRTTISFRKGTRRTASTILTDRVPLVVNRHENRQPELRDRDRREIAPAYGATAEEIVEPTSRRIRHEFSRWCRSL